MKEIGLIVLACVVCMLAGYAWFVIFSPITIPFGLLGMFWSGMGYLLIVKEINKKDCNVK